MEKEVAHSTSVGIGIDMKRYLCIHSVSQIVDITLQSLLYQRQIISEPVSTLIKGDSHAAEKFRTTYEKVTRILQKTFRTPNIGRLAEFVILIGGTPYSPKEIYRIPVPVCRSTEYANDEEERENEQTEGKLFEDGEQREKGCGQFCEELSAKEKRLVFSAVALSKTAIGHFESCPVTGNMDKVFMFIRTKGPLNTWTEGLVEDESFELPDDKMQQRRKIRQLRVQVHSPCCGNITDGRNHHENGSSIFHANSCDTEVDGRMDDDDSEEEGDENTMSYWHRLAPFFKK